MPYALCPMQIVWQNQLSFDHTISHNYSYVSHLQIHEPANIQSNITQRIDLFNSEVYNLNSLKFNLGNFRD